jgi:hypothetical protein
MLMIMATSAKTIELDPQHKLFADKYLETGRISASARHAGYSSKSAHVSGNRLLKRPEVQAYLAQRSEELSAQINEQEDSLELRVQRELEKMAFANIQKFIRIEDGKPVLDLSDATEEDLAALTSVRTKSRSIYNGKGQHIATEDTADVVMADKYRGLELLGKTVGMFKEAEHRVILDVADRLVAARRRLSAASELGNSDSKLLGGGGSG